MPSRRELLQGFIGAAALDGGYIKNMTMIHADRVPIIGVLTFQQAISESNAMQLREHWKRTFPDGPFGAMKIVVLGEGSELTAFDKDGLVCTEAIENWYADHRHGLTCSHCHRPYNWRRWR